MIDRKHIGRTFEPLTVDVEAGQLKFFAKATGQDDPIYFDEAKAREAGHPALPAPPTFAFCLSMARPESWLAELEVDLGKVLHGEQQFDYTGTLIHAGDRITLEQSITDIYEKKGGALEFIVTQTRVSNQRGEALGTMRGCTIVRNA